MCQCTRERAASLARRMEIEGLYATVGTAVLALAFAALTTRSVLREDQGTERMREIAAAMVAYRPSISILLARLGARSRVH